MKKWFAAAITSMLVSTSIAVAQNGIAYYDALTLRKSVGALPGITPPLYKFRLADSAIFSKHLLEYVPGHAGSMSIAAILDAYANNPFIRDLLPTTGTLAAGEGSSTVASSVNFFAAAASIPGLDVTNVADGLAKFMVERFEEELEMSFFNQFKADLADKKYDDLQTLFPETFKILNLMGTQIYSYNSYLESFRAAFKTDINNLYVNIRDLLNHPEFRDYFNKHPELGSAVGMAFYVVDQLSMKKHPGEILEDFDVSTILGPENSQPKTAIQGTILTLKAISRSLRNSSPSHGYWVSTNSVRNLVEDQIAFRIYLGLLYEEDSAIQFTADKNFGDLLTPIANAINTSSNTITGYENFIVDLSAACTRVSGMMSQLQSEENDGKSVDYKNYYGLIDAMYDLLNQGLSITELPGIDSLLKSGGLNMGEFKKETSLVLFAGQSLGNLYVDVRINNYSTAILHTAAIIDSLSKYGGLSKASNMVPTLIKYGSFMANMVYAKNSDDVKNAIEAVALPPTSASAKRKSGGGGITLNGYLGFFGGWETVPGEVPVNRKNTAGVSAPVGLELHFVLPQSLGSVGLFVPIIDIGALASFRLQDSSSAILPVKLGNIIAPGLGITYGVPWWPISVSGMYQLGPLLRDINSDAMKATESMNFRWIISVSADIPIFNIKSF
jgi:hypothetical protein